MTLETEAFVMQASPEGESPDLSGVIALSGGDETLAAESEEESRADSSDAIDAPPPTSTLIEFPGVNRRAEPPWRKELSRRVREVQERRTREAAEAPLVMPEIQPVAPDPVLSQLELVPELLTPAMNQLVENALRRVER